MTHTEIKEQYTNLLGWTDEEYAQRCAEQSRIAAEREEPIAANGFTCRVKDAPIGRTYNRPWSATNEQQEVWK